MARNDAKKANGRQLVERIEDGDGLRLFAFAPALYGIQHPTVTVLDDGDRVVLPNTVMLERWLGATKGEIAAHFLGLASSETGDFIGYCTQVLDEKDARERLVATITERPHPCATPHMTDESSQILTRLVDYMRTQATPLDVAYAVYLYAMEMCPKNMDRPQEGVSDSAKPAFVTQIEERYISRVAFHEALYGTAKRRDIFVGDDVLLTIPDPFRWDGWMGQERATFFSRLTMQMVDEAWLQVSLFVAVVHTGGVAELREKIRRGLPLYRQALRERRAGLPLTRLPVEAITSYLLNEASPLEIAVIAADIDAATDE